MARSATPNCYVSREARTASPVLIPATVRVLMYTSAPRPNPRACSIRTGLLLAEATSRVYTLNGPGRPPAVVSRLAPAWRHGRCCLSLRIGPCWRGWLGLGWCVGFVGGVVFVGGSFWHGVCFVLVFFCCVVFVGWFGGRGPDAEGLGGRVVCGFGGCGCGDAGVMQVVG